MSSLIWRSTGAQVTAVITLGENNYTFADGIPSDVPNDLVAAITTKLNALADTLSVTAAQGEI